ncbi:hypothetical protein, partial [Klebsiella pneumoniae]|uniref:hypothetical protein n=1 Tax=Klebsiella pneumoniae TaxID=573 RepID=UPI001AEFF17E
AFFVLHMLCHRFTSGLTGCCVFERVRPIGLIYQQSVEGDSRTLKIKNPLKAGRNTKGKK